MGDSREDLDVAASWAASSWSRTPWRATRRRSPNVERTEAADERGLLRGGHRSRRLGSRLSLVTRSYNHRSSASRDALSQTRRLPAAARVRQHGRPQWAPVAFRVHRMDRLAEEVVDAINDDLREAPGAPGCACEGDADGRAFTAFGYAVSRPRRTCRTSPCALPRASPTGAAIPRIPDYAKEGRGMAVKFYLPDGSTNGHRRAQPAVLLRANARGLPRLHAGAEADPERLMPDFDSARASRGAAGDPGRTVADPPASYATVPTTRSTPSAGSTPDGGARWVRYRFEPEAGEQTCAGGGQGARAATTSRRRSSGARGPPSGGGRSSPTRRRRQRPDCRLARRTRARGGRPPGADRPRTEREQGDDILVFDPTRVTDGIELSDDQILRFRPRAYSVSVARRAQRRLSAWRDQAAPGRLHLLERGRLGHRGEVDDAFGRVRVGSCPTTAWQGTPPWRQRVATSPTILPCRVCSSSGPRR